MALDKGFKKSVAFLLPLPAAFGLGQRFKKSEAFFLASLTFAIRKSGGQKKKNLRFFKPLLSCKSCRQRVKNKIRIKTSAKAGGKGKKKKIRGGVGG